MRADLYNVQQLEQFATALAEQHLADPMLPRARHQDRLLPRLQQNEQILVETYDLVTTALAQSRRLAPGAEWLLDNFYLIEEQILTARRHLPRSYSRQLPQLGTGPAAGLPRVYALVLPLISHVDGQVDALGLHAYIAAYQRLLPLTLGELWALPIMLRLALLENLRRVALRIGDAHLDRQAAAGWAQRMLKTVEEKPSDLILVMADMARANPPLTGAFLAELTRHLYGQSPYFAFARNWLEHRLSDTGLTVDLLVRAEGQAQAADQVSMGNSITSLRLLSSTDWESFVESHSVVEWALLRDPAGIYEKLDFATRDRYRHEVEAMAQRSPFTELAVATKATELARAAGASAGRQSHVGYYLIDQGRPALEAAAGVAVPWTVRVGRTVLAHPLPFYLGGVLILTTGLTTAFLTAARELGASTESLLWLSLPIILCAAQAGVAAINWIVTALVAPRSLPRLDYRKGIPATDRTMIVVPTMLSSAAGIDDLLSALEVRYLSNRDPHLHFALLTDLADAAQEVLPADAALVQLAQAGIERLNMTYRGTRDDIFFLFHRGRRWNAQDNVWMGYERKRGKLVDFNARLRGEVGRFAVEVGPTDILPSIRYVITLDTDTQLPADAACEMVAAMSHPLNRPEFDARHRVIAGYTILQPRVGVTLPSSQRSEFARLFAGDVGIDPYTRAVSDVYQDLFAEGSFIGKGIYDVDAFARVCSDFPENTILSHDLLESAYARSGLLSDVTLYEDCPSVYSADVSRRHRWIRGDWQIAGWLLPRVPDRTSEKVRNPISRLSQWKILDNLRRSLVPVAVLILLVTTWLWLPALNPLTIRFVLATLAAVPLMIVLGRLTRKPPDLPQSAHWRAAAVSLGRETLQFLLLLVLLPTDAGMTLDAVSRTVVRMLWTRRRLLEWKTFGDAERSARPDLAGFLQAMWFAPAVGLSASLALWVWRPESLAWAAPLVCGWIISPLVAWGLSRPVQPRAPHLLDSQVRFLRRLARRTWRYFEEHVTVEENWLPPDNVQENPERIASRTSPTNIGMALLADLTACDFGYCSASRLLDRVQKTLGTLDRLDRYHGHFFNWYDTRTLEPLTPCYVSTVDSGNLAGHLLVLSQGLLELGEAPAVGERVWSGLQDTAGLLLDAAAAEPADPDLTTAMWAIQHQLVTRPSTVCGWVHMLASLSAAAGTVENLPVHAEVRSWSQVLQRTCADHRAHLLSVAPWADLPPAPEVLSAPFLLMESVTSWKHVAAGHAALAADIDARLANPELTHDAGEWLRSLETALAAAAARASAQIQVLRQLAQHAQELACMDFSFLFDRSRDLFAIGYNVQHERLDAGFYDLLASEARLGSYVCIAQGQVPQEHWFALGRRLTTTSQRPALLSWSGSMFEYLMPLLVMPTYPHTLLDHTYEGVVRRQIEYGRQRGVPWGISESGYNFTDQAGNYQYRGFGVPGLALKRGLSEDVVIAPYASVLALMIAPEAACRNLERLAAEGQLGGRGFYEAIDYTPARMPPGLKKATVREVMAHHAGMSLLSLAYLLLDRPMQRRFAADPMLRSAQQLLQERVPNDLVAVYPHAAEARARELSVINEGTFRIVTDPGGPAPEVHLLSNGRYHVMVTSAGSGYSRWGHVALTRWREDATSDGAGMFCYVRDLDDGTWWSSAWQPACRATVGYEAIFTEARVEFRRRDHDIACHTEIGISPEDDVELRRVTLINHSDRRRRLELTSYAEVVLAPLEQDLSHPAFSNLFVQTEIDAERQRIICTRRPRSAEERPPWMMHLVSGHDLHADAVSFETDRMRFIGRGRSLGAPRALLDPSPLSHAQGPVLDPIVSIRKVLTMEPGETVRVDFVTGAAATREELVLLMDKYHDPRLADRVFDLAWTHGQILLQQLQCSEAEAQMYGRLAGSIVYASALRRSPASELIRNHRHQSDLWRYGISGDLPLLLVRIRHRQGLELVQQAVQAHAWWRMKGLEVDLVIWHEDASIYLETVQDSLMDLLSSGPGASLLDRRGGIFLRRGKQISQEDRWLLKSVARAVLLDEAGTFAEQVDRRHLLAPLPPPHRPSRRDAALPKVDRLPGELALFNGIGGFTQDGREYVMTLSADDSTPAPWVNVIANPQFGTVVSERGSSYTWAENSHEFRLTPWGNDATTDDGGEALYLRDEENGRFWSPSPWPAAGSGTYRVRHGFGYSVFEYTEDGISTEWWTFVAVDAPVKFSHLKVTNRSARTRQLTCTGYWEWVLGDRRHKSAMHVVTEIDPQSGALLARQRYSAEFGDRIAFVHSSEEARSSTGDRTEFIGRNGRLDNPQAMRRVRLSGRVGAGMDPAAALQLALELQPGQEKEVVFILGSGRGEEEVHSLVDRFRGVAACQRAQDEVWRYWTRTLGALHVETPDVAFNLLANGWLVYQVLACRMWARTGFYQSGGAYGFRDQLQDAMALIHAAPELLREHLLRAASRQFVEGDVQHWWHPPMGRGVRTRFSDDFLWLPYAVCRYVRSTGDTGVLDAPQPFLTGRAVREDEEAYYDLPQVVGEEASLYDHCVRAIQHGLRCGVHGLPLMGCGDWNDGMNRVGIGGKGESVWLGFFLYDVLRQFSQLSRGRGDMQQAEVFMREADALRENLNRAAWDGAWYLRAWFDDGTPLGSAKSLECQIDALPQSWAVLSGAGAPERSTEALRQVVARLVDRRAHLIKLMEPPFDRLPQDPGYIKGYPPGIRENGGQYTHAAVWTVMALAELAAQSAAADQGAEAWELCALLNPAAFACTPEAVDVYRVEPYVMAGDVYSMLPHPGYGGWTWYTGSAGWMYRLMTESLLGLHREGETLRFSPCPGGWPSCKIHYRYRDTFYHITLTGDADAKSVVVDGLPQPDMLVHLVDDRAEHQVSVTY
ncbi:MAG: GH36-type glycosyl hydrolase domain-containing protein [Candidatus Xenobia bacterium]